MTSPVCGLQWVCAQRRPRREIDAKRDSLKQTDFIDHGNMVCQMIFSWTRG
jgi:hypothetical protein